MKSDSDGVGIIGGVKNAIMKKDKMARATMISDAVGIIGVGLFAYGFWLVYRPLGFIVLGVMLAVGAILWARGNA